MNKLPQGKIAFVILAAGGAKRMGEIKQLLPWQEKSLISHIIDKGIDSQADKTYVVLGASAEKISTRINNKPVIKIINQDWKEGIGSSISAAVTHIVKSGETFSGILISLADQPLIKQSHFNLLIEAFASGNLGIAATSFSGSAGVPAIFGPHYYNKLIDLSGNKGAKSLIISNLDDSKLIDCNDLYFDIDTPGDYKEFLRKYK